MMHPTPLAKFLDVAISRIGLYQVATRGNDVTGYQPPIRSAMRLLDSLDAEMDRGPHAYYDPRLYTVLHDLLGFMLATVAWSEGVDVRRVADRLHTEIADKPLATVYEVGHWVLFDRDRGVVTMLRGYVMRAAAVVSCATEVFDDGTVPPGNVAIDGACLALARACVGALAEITDRVHACNVMAHALVHGSQNARLGDVSDLWLVIHEASPAVERGMEIELAPGIVGRMEITLDEGHIGVRAPFRQLMAYAKDRLATERVPAAFERVCGMTLVNNLAPHEIPVDKLLAALQGNHESMAAMQDALDPQERSDHTVDRQE